MLKPNEVKTENIANNAVTTSKIEDEAVSSAKLREGAVKQEHISAKAVGPSELQDRAVTTGKIANSAVTQEKIASGAVTTGKIGEKQVTASRLADRAVTTEKLANSAVTTQKIADGSVTKAKLSFTIPEPDGGGGLTRPITPPVATDEIADGAVTADKLADDSVTQTKIARNSVGWSEIKEQSLEPEQIKTLSGAPATEGQIPVADLSQANQWWFRWADAATRPLTPPLTSAELGVGSVESDKIAAGAVVSSKLSVDSIITEKIQNGAVTQEKLAPGVGGDRFTFLASSVEALYLTDITADIPYTAFDLSSWVPANAKGVLVQLGIFNQAFTNGRAFFRVRTNETQRDAIGVGMAPGGNSQMANQGIVPLTTDARTIEYALESVGGPWVATLTLYITVVGYIV